MKEKALADLPPSPSRAKNNESPKHSNKDGARSPVASNMQTKSSKFRDGANSSGGNVSPLNSL